MGKSTLRPVAGNPHGDVTIVEFFDYRCPYCRAVAPDLAKAVAADGKVRLIYKEFPILGPASTTAAKAALAAVRQGRYLVFHDRLFAFKGNLDDAAIYAIARELGLDVARLLPPENAAGFKIHNCLVAIVFCRCVRRECAKAQIKAHSCSPHWPIVIASRNGWTPRTPIPTCCATASSSSGE